MLARGHRRARAADLTFELLERPEHQCQRRAELVADIGEEKRLGAVDLGQRLGALALLLVGPRVREPGRDLARH
jgi:hypothetical protein